MVTAPEGVTKIESLTFYRRTVQEVRILSIREFKDRILFATDRLKSTVQLAPLYRDENLKWLRENTAGAVKVVIEFDDPAGLNTLTDVGIFTGENIDENIELASSTRKPEILSYLMNYKNAEIGISETDYEL